MRNSTLNENLYYMLRMSFHKNFLRKILVLPLFRRLAGSFFNSCSVVERDVYFERSFHILYSHGYFHYASSYFRSLTASAAARSTFWTVKSTAAMASDAFWAEAPYQRPDPPLLWLLRQTACSSYLRIASLVSLS